MGDRSDYDRDWLRAQALAVLEAAAGPWPDHHDALLAALAAEPADTAASPASLALSAHLAQHRALRTRATARIGVHPDDVPALMGSRGGMRAQLFARAPFDVWAAGQAS